MTVQSRTVLIDLERKQAMGARAEGEHPLQLSPARLPCALHGEDLARLHAFASGQSSRCDVVLSFRLQDLDDLGVPIIQANDCLTGVFDICGAKLLELPEDKALQVETTFISGGGVSLGRPGRHLLCAQFSAPARRPAPPPALAHAVPVAAAASESAANTPTEALAD